MSNSNRNEIFILVLCLLIGFALRFYTFDQKSLWMDEIYTFNDSRDNFEGQLRFYGENPTFLHPPLFFILTHLFYPFPKPERDLRVIPLIFGTLSILVIYFLSRSFSPAIALPFIALSQILWFYRTDENKKYPSLFSIFILNGLVILLCIPWLTFLAFNY